jgi:hypothetical protein
MHVWTIPLLAASRGIERSRYRGGSGGGWVIRME